jgi:His Kinase A (phospho-acceptor) domain/GAF domain
VVPPEIAKGFGIGSFVIVPLLSGGRCLGFMTCDERGRAFKPRQPEVELLNTFGVLIAAFLERAIEHSELRRLNELKSQFAALASHELRTPVAAIYGAVQTLDEREAELSLEKRTALRRMLTKQSRRLVELVESLLDPLASRPTRSGSRRHAYSYRSGSRRSSTRSPKTSASVSTCPARCRRSSTDRRSTGRLQPRFERDPPRCASDPRLGAPVRSGALCDG